MLRKQQGKKAQRRKYEDESSAPKRRKTDEGEFKYIRNISRVDDQKMEGDKRKSDEKLDQPIERKCRKTQTIMERYLISGESTERTNGGKVGVHGAGHEEEADAGHQAGAGHGEAVRVDSTGYEEADRAHLARENDIDSGETGSAWIHAEWCAGEGGRGVDRLRQMLQRRHAEL